MEKVCKQQGLIVNKQANNFETNKQTNKKKHSKQITTNIKRTKTVKQL